MRKFFVLTLGLMLAGCGGSDTQTTETEDGTVEYSSDGSTVEMRTTDSEGREATFTSNSGGGEADLPDGFSVYDGATVVSNTVVDASDGSGNMVTMTSTDSVEDIIAHYRAEAEQAGIEVNVEMNTNGNRMIAGEGADGLTFMVNVSGGDGESTVTLTVGRGSQ